MIHVKYKESEILLHVLRIVIETMLIVVLIGGHMPTMCFELLKTLQTKDVSEMYSRTIILIIGCHLRLGMSPQVLHRSHLICVCLCGKAAQVDLDVKQPGFMGWTRLARVAIS